MDSVCEVDRKKSEKLLIRECDNLLNEVERLNTELSTQERRLKNVMDLVSPITSVCRIYFLVLGDRYSVVSISLTVDTCGI
jgi:Sec7-like guanine-nucleotide exchange factor